MIFTRLSPVATGLLLTLIGGCVGAVPDPPERPALVALGEASMADNGEAQVLSSWWTGFDDPAVTEFARLALQENRTLAEARASLDANRALLAQRRLGASPDADTTGAVQLGRPARDGAETDVSANATLGARWEWDVFGRIAAEIDAAEADLESARQLRRDVAVTVASEAALAYADLRGAQTRLAVAQRNAAVQEQSLELLRTLLENGRATQLDLERAQAQFSTTLAGIPLLEAAVEAAASRLSALTGVSALREDTLARSASETVAPIPQLEGPLLILPLEQVVRQRPDIRRAEAQLDASLALGEVARANLFPTIVLNADLLSAITDATDVNGADLVGFGIGPAIRWSGPDLRRQRLEIDAADARALAAIAAYEATVLTALDEVNRALIAYASELRRRSDLVRAVTSAETALELARLRFQEGFDSFLDVLDAQRTLLDAEDRLAASRLQTTRNAIAAYRAIGGMLTDDALDRLGRQAEGQP